MMCLTICGCINLNRKQFIFFYSKSRAIYLFAAIVAPIHTEPVYDVEAATQIAANSRSVGFSLPYNKDGLIFGVVEQKNNHNTNT